MPLDRLPCALRGDAHGLVVVAHRAAGGERITEPEVVLGRDLIGEVREGCGALVGGDHEVGVVAVVADHVRWRDDLAVLEVVGHFEHRGDELAVGRTTFLRPAFAVGGGIGQPLGEEAALRPDRDDHRVLDLLGLDQAEDLGAEVLAAIAPAQATAGHRAEAQVHAFHAR